MIFSIGICSDLRRRLIEAQNKDEIKSSISAIQLACKIIGVSEQATMLEIKKAYRSLVKLHHPDRFATESLAQQQIAEQKFIEIQKAYEILERR